MVRSIIQIVIIAFTLPLLATAVMAGENCTCSHKGSKVPEGQSVCIRTSSGSQMAQCSRVLNNTSWKFLGTPCPTASIDYDNNQSNFDYEKATKNLKRKLG